LPVTATNGEVKDEPAPSETLLELPVAVKDGVETDEPAPTLHVVLEPSSVIPLLTATVVLAPSDTAAPVRIVMEVTDTLPPGVGMPTALPFEVMEPADATDNVPPAPSAMY